MAYELSYVKGKMDDFYSSCLFNPLLPDNVRFRHFRFKKANGEWVKVTKRIRNRSELAKSILSLEGADIYYSTSSWLNPDKLAGKGEEDITKVILLDNDLVFDIDCEDPFNEVTLEHARKSTFNIYEAMKCFGDRFVFEYAAFTGRKGFRLSYKDTELVMHEDPRKRIALVEDDRKLFIAELLKKIEELKKENKLYKVRTILDKEITTNPLCVVRVLGSAHSKTGFITRKIPVSMLKRNIKEIIDSTSCIYEERPGIPKKELFPREMTMDKELSPSPRPLQEEEADVSGLASPHFYYLSNRVVGTSCFVPVFIYQKAKKDVEKEIKSLQEKHGLGDLITLVKDNDLIFVSLKLFQRRQLVKMLNESTSRTKHLFKKYDELYFSTDSSYIGILKGELRGQRSKSHAEYFKNKHGISFDLGSHDTKTSKIKIGKKRKREEE